MLCPTELTLCSGPVEINGRTIEPDDTKAVIECRLLFAFPAVNYYGFGVHPAVIGRSYRSLELQKVDLLHLVKSYDPETITHDRIIGTVAGVEFPREPAGGWRAVKEQSPCVRAILSIYKQAQGVDRLLGQHLGGRKEWTTSIEYSYQRKSGIFCVNGKPDAHTPQDLAELGWKSIPFTEAPEELLATLPTRPYHRIKEWNGKAVAFLCGGVAGQISCEGIGLVENSAEEQAVITRVLADGWHGTGAMVEQFLAASKSILKLSQKKP